MAMRPSIAVDLSRLVNDLLEDDEARRESAAARLAIIGERAVPRLMHVAGRTDAPPLARAAAFRALAGIADPRAIPAAIHALTDPHTPLVVDAIDALGAFVHGTGPAATAAFDRLAELALDRSAEAERRLAAIGALDGLPERLLRPIYETLASDPASRVVARIVRRQAGTMLSLDEFVERGLPSDPAAFLAALQDDADAAKITTLRRAVDAVRLRESTAADGTRMAWGAVRGRLHQALADRHSRIAVYDLRETLERVRGPLPAGFIAATARIGDATFLEPLAAAWTASTDASERCWRDHLLDTFQAIVRREGLTRRAPAIRRILERHPDAGPLVALAKKS
jgi:hypothetical protein